MNIANMANTECAKIFVVGRDGNGKTSTIATIVGEKSETLQTSGEIEVKFSPKNNVSLADGVGVGEPLEDLVLNDIKIEKIINNVDYVMNNVFNKLLTAIVFVFKFGVRFTMQEKKCLQIVKDIFGQDVMKRRGVVVITYGDNFDKNVQETFQEWCQKQESSFQSLMEECNYRCVLFDNRDGSKRETQVKQFMAAVAQIDHKRPYEYAPNSNSRKKLIKEYTILKANKKSEEEENHITEKQEKCDTKKCLAALVILIVIFIGIAIFCAFYFF
ncbi:uncharacterized protein LOC131938156 [Physella acuta]|uniref:uncharacterized protein LOC131938156 n=1 Tax=Physella acuta TaxID=109671 RepID=UPI0027DC65A0|nr:uncharacterized protein LOC131938156 [Physella acuta]